MNRISSLFRLLRLLVLASIFVGIANPALAQSGNGLVGIVIAGPSTIDEGKSAVYSIVVSYADSTTRTLTTKTSSGIFGGTDYSLGFANSSISSVSSGLTSNGATSNLTFTINATMTDGSLVSANGSFTVTGAAGVILGGTVVGSATLTSDQTVTLSASYTEGGITKTATLPITVVHVRPVTTTSSSTSTTTSSTTITAPTTTTTSTTTTTTLPIINLTTGWNLVGNGVEAPITVASTFNDATKVTTVWKWFTSGNTTGIAYPAWAFYTPTQTDGGQAYAASKGYDFLTTINAGEGFWVNAKTAFSVPLSGIAVQSSSFRVGESHWLPLGWNLIATGDTPTPRTFNCVIDLTYCVFATTVLPESLTTLWAWDATLASWYFWAPSLVNNGGLASYIASKGYLDFTTNNKALGPGMGFWVNKP